jgi:hypothetical protein
MARWTQTKLVSTIQDYMDRVAARIDRQPLQQKLNTEHQLLGMTNLAKRLGVACDCFYTEWIEKPRTVCRCRPMTASERKTTGRFTGTGALGGKGCRDKEGVFVPVPQCRGIRRKAK